MKSIMGGCISYCTGPHERMCQCEDHYQEDMQDVIWNQSNIAKVRTLHLRVDRIVFVNNSEVYFGFIGGLLNQAILNGRTVDFQESPGESSSMPQWQTTHGDMDVVHLSMIG